MAGFVNPLLKKFSFYAQDKKKLLYFSLKQPWQICAPSWLCKIIPIMAHQNCKMGPSVLALICRAAHVLNVTSHMWELRWGLVGQISLSWDWAQTGGHWGDHRIIHSSFFQYSRNTLKFKTKQMQIRTKTVVVEQEDNVCWYGWAWRMALKNINGV